MIALACGILLLPSALTALAGYRDVVLVVYGAMLMAGLIGLLLVPLLVPILERWRYTREIGTFAAAARRVLIGPRSPAILAIACLVHALTILIVWSLGRAQGLALPVSDAAVLFTVMVGISIIPVSVGGWGLRELAVVSRLGRSRRRARARAAVLGLLRPGFRRRLAAGRACLAPLSAPATGALARSRPMSAAMMLSIARTAKRRAVQ